MNQIDILKKWSQKQTKMETDLCNYGVDATEEAKNEIRMACEMMKSHKDGWKASTDSTFFGTKWTCNGQYITGKSHKNQERFNGYKLEVSYIKNKFSKEHPEVFMIKVSFSPYLTKEGEW